MGAAVCMAAALAACGGGGGGGTPPVSTPTPTVTPTITPTAPPGTNVTLSGSQQTANIPAVAGYSGTITVPTGSGSINITDSTANPSGVTLQSVGAPRPEATASSNPYGCVGSTTYNKTGTHSMVAAPPHPIAGGDSFAYSGTLSSTYSQTAPCPEPSASSNATVAVTVLATPTALPGVGTVSDLQSTESDAFPTETTTTVTDQYVQNAGSAYELFEQKSSDGNGNSLDRKYTTAQLLDKLPETPSDTWTNSSAQAGTMTETLADGTSVSRTIANDGSYTENETFPNLQTTTKTPLLYFTVTAETNATINGIPGFTLTVPAGITGSVSLAILSSGAWTTVEGPVSISASTATFPVSAGTLTLTQGQKVYLAIFQTTSGSTASGSASISVKGQATGSSIDGSGMYAIAGTTFAYAAPGSGTITLTIGGSTQRTFPAWFTVPASYITDTFVDNGQVLFDSNCSVNGTISTQAGGKGNRIVETNSTLDPVLGYQETRVTTSYVVNGYGAVCVKIDDTLNSFYDYQNDTTKIDYQSQTGSPNSVNHIVEYLGMSSPAVQYTSVRKQSVSQQGISPLTVAQHVAAIQLQRDTQRAAKIRELLKGNVR